MTTYTATYSPEDNKLRLYASTRLDAETYARVKAAGFIWAPKQDLFVAPMWTPARADLLQELAGEIGDEDTSLVDRAEQRAERFEDYSDKRMADAEAARDAVAAIADGIPMGQPILVGHHSERHARKDAERIESGMRKAVKMWETSEYWTARAKGAIRHAKYKERPDVRARRIKGLEADQRKQEKIKKEAETFLRLWLKINDGTAKKNDGTIATPREIALYLANRSYISQCFPLDKYPRQLPASQYEGAMSIWSAITDGVIDEQQALAIVVPAYERTIEHATRWLAHIGNRLAYERAMMADVGGLVSDKTGPEKGGAVRCWASPRGGWSYIQKINKVSVTILDNWGNGGRNFTRTIPFDKLAAVMTAAEVSEAKAQGRVTEIGDGIGFHLSAEPPASTPEAQERAEHSAEFQAMKASLKAGVAVVAAPQLFPTPRDLADRVADLADIQPGHRILEPSAGTGNLLRALPGDTVRIAVEISQSLANGLYPFADVRCADFLECNGDLGTFDRIVMNPPFENGADIRHIRHALTFLKEGGRLVAICANGPRQRETLQPIATEWHDLPPGTFKEAGTMVNAALLVIDR